MEVLYQAQGLLVSHDAPHSCLLIEWQGVHDGPTKRACCQTILKLIQQTNATKGLVNGKHDLDGWNEAVEWLGHEYQEELATHGVVAVAWVMPDNVAARLHAERVVDSAMHPAVKPHCRIQYNVFNDVEAASFWLIHRAVPHQLSSTVVR